ncbi:MAG: hypothetical protein QNJ54_21195 [Prochloraceae cyanobacterium]|nr:hypothetical protein [Prochloraceae cyanobacterium]
MTLGHKELRKYFPTKSGRKPDDLIIEKVTGDLSQEWISDWFNDLFDEIEWEIYG